MAAARENTRSKQKETPAQLRQRERLQLQVGARIAELREAKGWTQAKLAEKLGMNMRHLQAIELGHQNLTLGSLGRAAKALGSDVASLFEQPQPRVRRAGRPRRAESD